MRAAAMVVIAAGCLLAGPAALAQGGRAAQPSGGKPTNVSPIDPPAAPKGEPLMGPLVKQVSPRDLTLRVRLVVNSDSPTQKITYRDPFTGNTVEMPDVRPFEFQTIAVVWPLLPSTASCEPEGSGLTGALKLNDVVVSEQPTVLKGYPGGVRLVRWDGGRGQSTTCRQVELTFDLPMRCFNTDYDERAALELKWPTAPWPADVQSLMRPQLFLETGVDGDGRIKAYDDAVLRTALERWLKEAGITDAKNVTPAALAKVLTAKVWAHVQPSGDGHALKRTGEFAGLIPQSPSWTIETGRGSEHDLAITLAALMRKAGLPSRVMFGWDVSGGGDKFLSKSNKENRLRSWVEFCLFDDANNLINWVPVDIAALRRTTNSPPALTRQWRYFGSHDQLQSVTPFAMHLHPPTDVVSYGWPGFWGWFVTPKAPEAAEQAIAFSATVSPRRPTTPADEERSKEPAKRRGY